MEGGTLPSFVISKHASGHGLQHSISADAKWESLHFCRPGDIGAASFNPAISACETFGILLRLYCAGTAADATSHVLDAA